MRHHAALWVHTGADGVHKHAGAGGVDRHAGAGGVDRNFQASSRGVREDEE